MPVSVYLVTPPFTQLNTPYPATAYLKGFLNTKGISSFQSDLGIETTLRIFSEEGLRKLFDEISMFNGSLSENAERIFQLRDYYIREVDHVIGFLQGRNPTLAHLIAKRNFLPEAGRFSQLADLEWAFGTMGVQDQAKHIATLFLEDLSDIIQETVDPHFGFSRYAERIARSAGSFDELYDTLLGPPTFTDKVLLSVLSEQMASMEPLLIAISVPFPGNLYAALRCGQWVKQHAPGTKVALGGGYANTELRSVADPRVFEFVDYITLDDGEAPVEQLLAYVSGRIPASQLKRTFLLDNGSIVYTDNKLVADYRQADTGTPDYGDLPLDRYISAIEILNPMHRLWSDGRWNKLTMAHGCYWGKCTFCDISLDYIKRYEPITASMLCDRMEELIARTGVNGFHFVDEAAPPSLMRALALEIIRRKMVVSWWTNIRFEKSFTRDLCLLLRASGCIGVSGGLEVASDRLLELIQKGITVASVARVNRHFTEAGIMVHAYLMYGFPTQTAQETVDSLEMVRQMFDAGILQSAYWHLFTMTAHSPVGMDPTAFGVTRKNAGTGRFANNDLEHEDAKGADHESFTWGLRKSLLNYMHGHGIDYPLQKWFDFPIPRTSVARDFIVRALEDEPYVPARPETKWVWTGTEPKMNLVTKSKKGSHWEMAELRFHTPKESLVIRVDRKKGEWLAALLKGLSETAERTCTHREIMEDYAAAGLDDFGLFWDNKPVNTLYRAGLLRL